MNGFRHREHLRQIFEAAVNAVDPLTLLPRFLESRGHSLHVNGRVFLLNKYKRIFVAGAGKATGAMAVAAERIFGERIADGFVALKNEPPAALSKIGWMIAGHPTPDENSVAAAEKIFTLVDKMDREDLLIFLLSGGASSLVTDLPPNVSLSMLNRFYSDLINSGASIHQINTVRKHLSQLKGGHLARRCKSTIISLIISDVADDDLSVIGSGPTFPDTSTFQMAMDVIKNNDLARSASSGILHYLEDGVKKFVTENPTEDDRTFERCNNFIIGNNATALNAAKEKAKSLGFYTTILPRQMTGNTEREAEDFVKSVSLLQSERPACIIAGGETTLNVTGTGKGGRNQHYALKAIAHFNGRNDISVLAAGTDGSDGPTDAAGAFADANVLASAARKGLDINAFLANNDSYSFFTKTDGLFITGPTYTNVMDIVIGLVI